MFWGGGMCNIFKRQTVVDVFWFTVNAQVNRMTSIICHTPFLSSRPRWPLSSRSHCKLSQWTSTITDAWQVLEMIFFFIHSSSFSGIPQFTLPPLPPLLYVLVSESACTCLRCKESQAFSVTNVVLLRHVTPAGMRGHPRGKALYAVCTEILLFGQMDTAGTASLSSWWHVCPPQGRLTPCSFWRACFFSLFFSSSLL